MAICVRYVDWNQDNKSIVREDFLSFVDVYGQDAENTAKVILEECKKLGLKMENCIGQGYDGASTMSGIHNGVSSRITRKYPKILYVHCSSHKLNLAISSSMNVPMIKNTLIQVEEITKYFRKNGHVTDVLKDAIKVYVPDCKRSRLINYCSTRFIERHDSITGFFEFFQCVCVSLEEISKDTKRKISSKAAGFLAAVEKSEFIISLLVCECLLNFTLPLSINLQAKALDLVSAPNLI